MKRQRKQKEICILIGGITSLHTLHSIDSLFMYSVCSLQYSVNSCLIQKMVPTAAIYSTSLNKDTFSGILDNN